MRSLARLRNARRRMPLRRLLAVRRSWERVDLTGTQIRDTEACGVVADGLSRTERRELW